MNVPGEAEYRTVVWRTAHTVMAIIQRQTKLR